MTWIIFTYCSTCAYSDRRMSMANKGCKSSGVGMQRAMVENQVIE
jgi:hypothetical protein